MPKKRIVFTILYDSGYFMLSRNFRLQRVGNLEWLQRNYNFTQIAFFIDELVVLDVTRKNKNLDAFSETLAALTAGCFVPIAAGGGVCDIDYARRLLRSGADKIVLNSALFDAPDLVTSMAREFGQQCIVGSVDLKRIEEDSYRIFTEMGSRLINQEPAQALEWIKEERVGELYINSIDRDGTGQGYDLGILKQLPENCPIPIILAGGVGNATHLAEGFADPRVDAVATAHLFNFVEDGLQRARDSLVRQGAQLASWPPPEALIRQDNPSGIES